VADKTLTKDELIEQIKKMSVLDLADLVHALEDEFGVSAAAPVAAAAPAAAGADAEPEEEKTSFDVAPQVVRREKIEVIKVVRALTGLGLKEAKAVVERPRSRSRKASTRTRPKRPRSNSKAAGANSRSQIVRRANPPWGGRAVPRPLV